MLKHLYCSLLLCKWKHLKAKNQGWQEAPVSHNSAGADRRAPSHEFLAKGEGPLMEPTAGAPFEILLSTEVSGGILCLRSVYYAIN